jgi:hypothetical protein
MEEKKEETKKEEQVLSSFTEGVILHVKPPYMFKSGEGKKGKWYLWSVGIQTDETMWYNATGFGSETEPPKELAELISDVKEGDYVELLGINVNGYPEVKKIAKKDDPFKKDRPNGTPKPMKPPIKYGEFRTPAELNAIDLLKEARQIAEKSIGAEFSNNHGSDLTTQTIKVWKELAKEFKGVARSVSYGEPKD